MLFRVTLVNLHEEVKEQPAFAEKLLDNFSYYE